MRTPSITLGIAVIVATMAIVAARAPEHRAASVTAIASEARLPGAVVVASKPTLKEIVDLIVGEQGSSAEQARIAAMLRKKTNDAALAERIARALVNEGKKANVGATLLAGILMVENPDLVPRATSSVGARGLMQVMPFHAGKWGCESNDLFDIESNICHGVRVLADNLKHSRNLPTALLKYNGCVRGTNTPDCHRYARIVYRYAQRSAVGPDGKVTASTPFSTKSE
ncbi:MAG TPA: lytic transglycosylase domain-containing protein [Gemmatimonadaceae bacterium]|nr:lytic transglycosylase domain-containing protein [Gemmatimonadaceae bacterium]